MDKISNTGSEIETLFVERIAQLLKPKGVAAVILPSSILNKENESFVAARESLLCNFYIRAVVQFGSKTFGATGTNTVVMFLEKNNEPPKRYKIVADAVNAILENRNLSLWEDKYILNAYLAKIDVREADYENFICRNNSYNIWHEHKYFGKYVDSFEHSKTYLDKKKQKTFTKMTDKEQQEWLDRAFYQMALTLEKEKLMYFALVYNQSTLIISAPADNKGQEKFLGYNWSNRKGAEGIQVINKGGMLYNDINRFAKDKLSEMVRAAFGEREHSLPDLQQYYYFVRTQDMLDFSGASFNKGIRTSNIIVENANIISTKYPSEIIGNLCIINPSKEEIKEIDDETKISFIEMASLGNGFIERKEDRFIAEVKKGSYKYFRENDLLFAKITPCMENGKCAIAKELTNEIGFGSSEYHVLRCSNRVQPEYLFCLLNNDNVRRIAALNMTGTSGHRRVPESFYGNLSVPVPPIEVQQKIVEEYKKVDNDIANAQKIIVDLEENITSKFDELFTVNQNKFRKSKLDNEIIINQNTYDPTIESSKKFTYVDIESVGKGNGIISYEKTFWGSNAPSRARRLANINDVIISTVRPNLKAFAIVRKQLTNTIFSTGFAVLSSLDENNIIGDFIYGLFMYDSNIMTQLLSAMPKGQYPSVNENDIKNLQIYIPPIELQQEFADFVSEVEVKKAHQKEKIEQLKLQREQIIEKYFD